MTLIKRILVIWDDVDDRNLFRFVFERAGYEVFLANTFKEGYAICLAQTLDIVIFPHREIETEDGLNFYKRLRSQTKFAQMAIIVGHIDHLPKKWKEAYHPIFEAGANACFGRVFDISDVIEQVELLLKDPSLTNLPDKQSLKFQ